jgi:pilus assembly protein CpaB
LALRKTQNLALKLDTREDDESSFITDDDVAVAAPAPEASSRPVFQPAPAQPLPEGFTVIPASRADRGRGDPRQGGDRRQGDRRAMDQLRTEALRNIISSVDDRSLGGARNKRMSLNGPRIPLSRLILLGVALLAGGVAAFLAVNHDAPAPAIATVPVQTVKPAPATQILVAKSNIGIGQRLTPAMLEWQDWPEATLRPDYVTIAAAPDAMTSMAKSVARGEFFPGEPIRAQKLTDAGHGFLSAILDSGKRGVSVQVSAEAASGGFIVPNDHVDVVLTRQTGGGQMSETILTNVRILAINANLGSNGASTEDSEKAAADPASQGFAGGATATLELDPPQAETIINSVALGRLSLMLRPTADDADAAYADQQRAANAAIRLTSPFWAGGTAAPVPAAAAVPQ